MFGNQTKDQLVRFRSLGGVQSYPSRTKDSADVVGPKHGTPHIARAGSKLTVVTLLDRITAGQDFSTGSVGLGAALTAFEAYIQDYLSGRGPEFQPLNAKGKTRPGRMVALVGDAELDEGA